MCLTWTSGGHWALFGPTVGKYKTGFGATVRVLDR